MADFKGTAVEKSIWVLFQTQQKIRGCIKKKLFVLYSLGSMKYKQFYEKKNVLAKNMNINLQDLHKFAFVCIKQGYGKWNICTGI